METIEDFLTIRLSDGYGDGSGSGDGSGYGSGYGYGYGYGSDDGLSSFKGKKIYYIDGIPTVIDSLKGNIAKCRIINDDLTTTNSYVVKVGNFFAHGESIKIALRDAENKHFSNLNVDLKIEAFKKHFIDFNKKVKAIELFEWHYKLTGSCEQGRLSFCKNKGINLDKDKFTVNEFVELTKGHYGSDIIKKIINI